MIPETAGQVPAYPKSHIPPGPGGSIPPGGFRLGADRVGPIVEFQARRIDQRAYARGHGHVDAERIGVFRGPDDARLREKFANAAPSDPEDRSRAEPRSAFYRNVRRVGEGGPPRQCAHLRSVSVLTSRLAAAGVRRVFETLDARGDGKRSTLSGAAALPSCAATVTLITGSGRTGARADGAHLNEAPCVTAPPACRAADGMPAQAPSLADDSRPAGSVPPPTLHSPQVPQAPGLHSAACAGGGARRLGRASCKPLRLALPSPAPRAPRPLPACNARRAQPADAATPRRALWVQISCVQAVARDVRTASAFMPSGGGAGGRAASLSGAVRERDLLEVSHPSKLKLVFAPAPAPERGMEASIGLHPRPRLPPGAPLPPAPAGRRGAGGYAAGRRESTRRRFSVMDDDDDDDDDVLNILVFHDTTRVVS
jgi:hypothetical protein